MEPATVSKDEAGEQAGAASRRGQGINHRQKSVWEPKPEMTHRRCGYD